MNVKSRIIITLTAAASFTVGCMMAQLLPSEATPTVVRETVTVPALPPITPFPPKGSVPCTEEDGSGPQQLPCFWGDGTIGVEHGLSYLVTLGAKGPDSRCFLYVDPAMAAKYNGCES